MRKYIRLLIGAFGIGFAIFVALQFRRPAPSQAGPAGPSVEPGAVATSTKGTSSRFSLTREGFRLSYDKQVTFADGSSKFIGLRIDTDERGSAKRSFTLTAREGKTGENDSSVALDGAILLKASDGMEFRTEQATYNVKEKIVRAPGPVTFSRGRLSGSGVGMTYDEGNDVMNLESQAVVHIGPDKAGAGAADITSGLASLMRREKSIRFENGVKVQQSAELIEADLATGRFSDDENHIESVELRGNSRITSSKTDVGALQSLNARDMDLKYAAGTETLERAHLDGDALIKLAGQAGNAGRQIAGRTIDITLAPDGSTPIDLTAREKVQLTIPAESGTPGRIIRSATLDAKGSAGRGLTRARFSGAVEYRETDTDDGRHANAALLDVGLKPGMSTIEDARFLRGVRFVQSGMTGIADDARYDPDKGTLVLSGVEPGTSPPHVETDQISVDATKIDVTLEGPKLKATGSAASPVKSVLQPSKKGAKPDEAVKMPSMLKQDQPVTVLATSLDYDGNAKKGVYTGDVRLSQGKTSIKSATLVLDDKTGDLTATGPVTTTSMVQQTNKDKKEEVESIGRAKDFKYEDSMRRLTYTGDAHLNGPQGDMSAAKIEVYLKTSGDEVDRVEAYEKLTLKEQNRTTTGSRLTYTASDDKYIVVGTPVEITDECDRKTTGKTLTFVKSTDTIVVDGNNQIRAQTKSGGAKCPEPKTQP